MVTFSDKAKEYLNGIIEEYNIPEIDQYLELTVVKPSPEEVKYVLMGLQEDDWDRIIVGKTHQQLQLEGLKSKVLIRLTQLKYFENLNIDVKLIETDYVFIFSLRE
jgi:hypothetical protein